MPVKRRGSARTRPGSPPSVARDRARDGEGQRGGAVQDDAGSPARAGDREVGVDRVPDARALRVDVGGVGGDLDRLAATGPRPAPRRSARAVAAAARSPAAAPAAGRRRASATPR